MRARFWAAVALQVLVLLGIAGVHGYTLSTGEAVLLRGRLGLPWNPQRGDYIDLQFDISELGADLPMEGWPYKEGEQVWVTLARGTPYWTAVSVSDRLPAVSPGQAVLRGRVLWFDPAPDGQRTGRVFLGYGIGPIYVPEGQGQEQAGQQVELAVDLRVDRTGRGVVHTIFLAGKPIEWR